MNRVVLRDFVFSGVDNIKFMKGSLYMYDDLNFIKVTSFRATPVTTPFVPES